MKLSLTRFAAPWRHPRSCIAALLLTSTPVAPAAEGGSAPSTRASRADSASTAPATRPAAAPAGTSRRAGPPSGPAAASTATPKRAPSPGVEARPSPAAAAGPKTAAPTDSASIAARCASAPDPAEGEVSRMDRLETCRDFFYRSAMADGSRPTLKKAAALAREALELSDDGARRFALGRTLCALGLAEAREAALSPAMAAHLHDEGLAQLAIAFEFAQQKAAAGDMAAIDTLRAVALAVIEQRLYAMRRDRKLVPSRLGEHVNEIQRIAWSVTPRLSGEFHRWLLARNPNDTEPPRLEFEHIDRVMRWDMVDLAGGAAYLLGWMKLRDYVGGQFASGDEILPREAIDLIETGAMELVTPSQKARIHAETAHAVAVVSTTLELGSGELLRGVSHSEAALQRGLEPGVAEYRRLLNEDLPVLIRWLRTQNFSEGHDRELMALARRMEQLPPGWSELPQLLARAAIAAINAGAPVDARRFSIAAYRALRSHYSAGAPDELTVLVAIDAGSPEASTGASADSAWQHAQLDELTRLLTVLQRLLERTGEPQLAEEAARDLDRGQKRQGAMAEAGVTETATRTR